MQDDAQLPEAVVGSSRSHVNGDVTLTSSGRHHRVAETPPQSPAAGGTLPDLKKRRSHDRQLRLYGASNGGGGDLASSDVVDHPRSSPSDDGAAAAEIYGHASSSPPGQNKLVQPVTDCPPCCRLM